MDASADLPPGDLAWYVYGVAAADADPPVGSPGVDPAQPVTTLCEETLAAIASQVPMAAFNEAALRAAFTDISWVEAVARAHERVVDEACAATTVVPMRMCTVFRTADGVREMLAREAPVLGESLAQLAGKAEWGLKIWADLETAGGALAGPPASPLRADAGPGSAYLLARLSERDRRAAAVEAVDVAARSTHERLCALAADARLTPPRQASAGDEPFELALTGAYLVADETSEQFHDELRRLQDELVPGVWLAVTGPWPAYNFVPERLGALA